jgi:hypothetical protein
VLCGGQASDKWIAFVFDVEFDASGQKHFSTSPRQSMSVGEFQGRLFAQKNAANVSVGIAGNPKSVAVLRYEE